MKASTIISSTLFQRRLQALALILIDAILLTACAGGGGEGQTEAPAPANTDAPPGEQASDTPLVVESEAAETSGGTATVEVLNGFEVPLCAVNIVPSDTGDWGSNLLAEPMSGGSTHSVTGIPAGSYHVRIVTCHQDVPLWTCNRELKSGEILTLPVGAPAHALVVQNQSSRAICAVSIMKVAETGDFGISLVGEGESIQPGEIRAFAALQGDADVHIESCQGDVMEQLVPISGATPFTVSG